MFQIHSVKDLYNYLMLLFEKEKTYLNDRTQIDWRFLEELSLNIEKIQNIDNRSTYFRYPVTANSNQDKKSLHLKKQQLKLC